MSIVIGCAPVTSSPSYLSNDKSASSYAEDKFKKDHNRIKYSVEYLFKRCLNHTKITSEDDILSYLLKVYKPLKNSMMADGFISEIMNHVVNIDFFIAFGGTYQYDGPLYPFMTFEWQILNGDLVASQAILGILNKSGLNDPIHSQSDEYLKNQKKILSQLEMIATGFRKFIQVSDEESSNTDLQPRGLFALSCL